VGATIVLADDEPDLRAVYAACLRNEGFEVWEASDGREALAMVAAYHPSLMLLDVWMPELNGLEVVEHLRNDPLSCQMRVVILSNLGDSDTRLEGFSAGVTDYWVKSLSLGELCQRVRQLITAPVPDPDRDQDPDCDFVEYPAARGE
jgi:DNA-binding response OmpR family regulator